MIIYFIEYKDSVKFFNSRNEFKLEVYSETIMNKFIDACKRRKCKLVNLLTGEVLK